jgi:DNA polymerase
LLAEHKKLTKTKENPEGVNVTQGAKVLEWMSSLGVILPNLTAEVVDQRLGLGDDPNPIPMPPEVHRALTIRTLVASSSIKKLKRMLACVNADGRSRGCFQYHGTGPGRIAGRLWQPTNLPRPTIQGMDPEAVVEAIKQRDAEYLELMYGPAVEVVVSSLRHAIMAAPGKVFLAGDYAGIQARVVLALAGQHDKTAIMASGQDIYCDMAKTIYGVEIDKKDPRRAVGKAAVLALGFGMGWQKFKLKYGKGLDDAFIQDVVEAYRKQWAPGVPKLWHGLGSAATKTVHTGRTHEGYCIEYRLEDGWLSARLPSGRKIWYWNPQPTREAMPWDENDIRPSFTYQAQKTGKLTTIKAFGGLVTENVVMGIERDIMTHGRRNLEREGFPVVMEVYDEAVCEVGEDKVDEKLFAQCMEDVPTWVRHLKIPVAVELWPKPAKRYRK